MKYVRRTALVIVVLALGGAWFRTARDGDTRGTGVAPVLGDLRGAAPLVSVDEAEALRERWGIEPTMLALSAAGYMVDFRYRVIDAEKARPLLDRRIKPTLIDDESGAKLIVPAPPKVGTLRSTSSPREGHIYFVVFANPGKLLKAGASVTVEIGGFRAPHMVIAGG